MRAFAVALLTILAFVSAAWALFCFAFLAWHATAQMLGGHVMPEPQMSVAAGGLGLGGFMTITALMFRSEMKGEDSR